MSAASAGTSPDAEEPVSTDLILWADVIFAMEAIHRRRINERFGAILRGKRVVVLGIPDRYGYMEVRLIEILKQKVGRHLKISVHDLSSLHTSNE